MINSAERVGDSSEINAEQQKHPLEQMPSFEEHMQSDFEQQNEDTTDDDENWIDDWNDEGKDSVGNMPTMPSGGAWGRPAGEGSPNLTLDEVKDAYETETETDGEYDDEEDETPGEPKMSFEEWLRIRRQNSTKALEESDEALKQREAEEVARKVAEEEERKAERERKELEEIAQEMGEKREELERKRKQEDNEFLKRQRIQEVVERDLSENLLKIEDLDIEVYAGNPEVEKRFVTWRKKDIPVYDLKGIPFKFLSTTIDYRKLGKIGDIGTETYQTVMKNPWIWTRRQDQVEARKGYGTRKADALGDTISASYWNSERNIGSHAHGDLLYGFEGVNADSIILVANGDGGTNNMAGNIRTTVKDTDAVKQLEGPEGVSTYNEVLLRRYSENGMPKRPDYVIVENGNITESVLRAARYYDIPIVNIENSFYEEKARKRGEEIMNSMSEEDTYQELEGKIEELLSMSVYKDNYNTLRYVGRNGDIEQQLHQNPTPLQERLDEISKMEMRKRLDYIKEALEGAISRIEEDTRNGVLTSKERVFPDFKEFNMAFGRDDEIIIDYGLKDGLRHMVTNIRNGESGDYSTLEPIVRRYNEVYDENKRIAGQQ